MKLKDYLKSWSKQSTYELYIRLIYEIKDYEKITKNKMIDDIVDIYHEPNYLFNIYKEKEIKFLKKIREGKLSLSDSYKYYWEINELNEIILCESTGDNNEYRKTKRSGYQKFMEA